MSTFPTVEEKIRVIIADDHDFLREALRLVLEQEEDITVVGEAATGREAVQKCRMHHPSIVLMDIAMPSLNGLEAARQILKYCPTVRIVIFSGYADDAYIDLAVGAGVSGFLVKTACSDELVKAVREVAAGNTFFSSSVRSRICRHDKTDNSKIRRRKRADLTSRELEVLQLLAEGMANKQTASELEISVKTVEKHRHSLMKKLDIRDTAGLTRYAISTGLVACGGPARRRMV